MKGARLILPGCTGFHLKHPEWGELLVEDVQGYFILCKPTDKPSASQLTLRFRDFEVLNYPREENCNKQENKD